MVERSQSRVGFFGGSYNPIHYGHLHLAKQLMEAHRLHEVWFCPARSNPNKKGNEVISVEHRLKMVQLAIEDAPSFTAMNVEAKREGPSYTVDTLRELLKREKEKKHSRQIYLMMSDELIAEFFHWKQVKDIVRMVPLLVGSRFITSTVFPRCEGDPQICKAIAKGWTATTIVNISSTEIRQRICKGLPCEHLVPKKVLDYIDKNILYSTTYNFL